MVVGLWRVLLVVGVMCFIAADCSDVSIRTVRIHFSASDSFSTMALYKSIYLLTYFTGDVKSPIMVLPGYNLETVSWCFDVLFLFYRMI